jgi:hypothetical protein
MRTDNGYLRRSLVEVVYPGARYATLPAVAPWLWALRPCCLSSCAAQGSSRLSGANGGPTRSGPAVVGDSMADDVRQKLSGQRSSIPTNSCTPKPSCWRSLRLRWRTGTPGGVCRRVRHACRSKRGWTETFACVFPCPRTQSTTLKLRSRRAPGARGEYQTASFDRGKLTLDLVRVLGAG